MTRTVESSESLINRSKTRNCITIPLCAPHLMSILVKKLNTITLQYWQINQHPTFSTLHFNFHLHNPKSIPSPVHTPFTKPPIDSPSSTSPQKRTKHKPTPQPQNSQTPVSQTPTSYSNSQTSLHQHDTYPPRSKSSESRTRQSLMQRRWGSYR